MSLQFDDVLAGRARRPDRGLDLTSEHLDARALALVDRGCDDRDRTE